MEKRYAEQETERRMRPRYDAHHLLHHRREWTLREQAERIRENPWLIPPIDIDVHTELHKNCPSVPLLGYYALQAVNNNFRPVPGDYIGSMESLMRSISESAEHPKMHRVERDLGRLAVDALETQKPYIVDGLVVSGLTR